MREIPECPVFAEVTIAGVRHIITPTPVNLATFVRPALKAVGLDDWFDGGAWFHVEPAVEAWWPEEPCPVSLTVTIEREDGTEEEYPRWPGLGLASEEELLADYPEDADDVRAYFAWRQRCAERAVAIEAAQQAVQKMGQARRAQILRQVCADLEALWPGFVGQLVARHCHDGHICACPEHDAQDMLAVEVV